jgi:hypothetical protein
MGQGDQVRRHKGGLTANVRLDVAYGSKAPFRNCGEHFRFTPNSGRE